MLVFLDVVAVAAISKEAITRGINPASGPTMRRHFGCIFKATAEYTT
jgi:hypothetical protein